MAIRTFTVLVGNWGANPSFARGETVTVDSDSDPKFPYDIDSALRNGVIQETTEGAEAPAAPTIPLGLLPSGAPAGIGAPAGAVPVTEEVPQAPETPADASAEESVLPPEEPTTPSRSRR